MASALIDPDTAQAAEAFMRHLRSRYDVSQAILFGNQARHHHHHDSDADIAVIIRGAHGKRVAVALDMAGIAFKVLLDTGVLVEALPLWEDEFEHPEHFSNPALIESIRRDGIRLWA